jgi:hypothetical protein
MRSSVAGHEDGPQLVAPFDARRLKDRGSPADADGMTVIRAACPTCGEVDLKPDAVLLHVLEGDSGGIYSFVCPTCREDVEKWADRQIIGLLRSAGVAVEDRSGHPSGPRPAGTEANPRERLRARPAFTLDDLIDFHFLLEDDRYIEESLSTSV